MTDIRRQHLHFSSADDILFGWIHCPENDTSDVVAVICNPLGTEYMSGHRSIRHLADQLAGAGIPALRFDYACTGDSSGGDFSNLSVARIVRNIGDAALAARSETGASRIALLGIGIGATFAAMAAADNDVQQLVMWNPVVSGRRYIREQKLLSNVLGSSDPAAGGSIDSAGIYLTEALQRELRAIDLTKIAWESASSVLLLGRDDIDAVRRLAEILSDKDLDFDYATRPGYRQMMDQPTETVVPADTFAFVCEWLDSRRTRPGTAGPAAIQVRRRGDSAPRQAEIPADDVSPIALHERASRFGTTSHLFGISTTLADGSCATPSGRAFVFLNCGSEHHAGPHRMYTRLCRMLASRGELAFRFDIEGIGDSFSIGNNPDNNAYSPVAIDDIDQALTFLTAEYGCEEFVLCGICAGAYHAFKAAAVLTHHDIGEVVLVNPLVFEWNYDDPEDHLTYELHTYRAAFRNRRNWWRFLTGDINYGRLASSMIGYAVEFSRRTASAALNLVTRRKSEGLPADLRAVATLGRRMALVMSEGDPGLNIMLLQARRETKRALRDGRLTVLHLEDSNHGLSKKHMQDRLVSAIFGKFFSRQQA